MVSGLLTLRLAPKRYSPVKRLPWLSKSTKPLNRPTPWSTLTRRSAAPTVWLGRISEVTAAVGRSLISSSGFSRPVSVMMSPVLRCALRMPASSHSARRVAGPALQLDLADAAFDHRDLHRRRRGSPAAAGRPARGSSRARGGTRAPWSRRRSGLRSRAPCRRTPAPPRRSSLVGVERVAGESELRDAGPSASAKPAARAWAPAGAGGRRPRAAAAGAAARAAARGSARRRAAAGAIATALASDSTATTIGLAMRARASPSLKRRTLISLTPGFLFRACVTRARQVRLRNATFLDTARRDDLLNASGGADQSRRAASPRPPLPLCIYFFPNSAAYRLFLSSTRYSGLRAQNSVIYFADQ